MEIVDSKNWFNMGTVKVTEIENKKIVNTTADQQQTEAAEMKRLEKEEEKRRAKAAFLQDEWEKQVERRENEMVRRFII